MEEKKKQVAIQSQNLLTVFKKQIKKDVINHYDRSDNLLAKLYASNCENEKL